MTTVYFIRHAQSDNSVRDDLARPLTEKGLKDRLLVTKYLSEKKINKVLSSPFKRAIDTVADFASKNGYEIEIIQDFRERKSDSVWIQDTDFGPFIERQWKDFSYSLSDGECLQEVQERNIEALNCVLKRYAGMNIIVGTHGTSLSTILNYYDSAYGFKNFMDMVNLMPWVVKMIFDGYNCISIDKINVL